MMSATYSRMVWTTHWRMLRREADKANEADVSGAGCEGRAYSVLCSLLATFL